MTTPKKRRGLNHNTAWFDELDDLGGINIANVRGLGRTLRRGLTISRQDGRTSRGNRRFARND
jgi:hypothetical protein